MIQWHKRLKDKREPVIFLKLTDFQVPGVTVGPLDSSFTITLLTILAHISRAYIFILYWVIGYDEFSPGLLLWL